MKTLRQLDLNEVMNELDELNADPRSVSDALILDGAHGHMFPFEGILAHAGFTNCTEDEHHAAYVGAEGALQSINEVFKTLGVKLEIVEVDLVDFTGWMLVPKGAKPKKVAKLLAEGRLTAA